MRPVAVPTRAGVSAPDSSAVTGLPGSLSETTGFPGSAFFPPLSSSFLPFSSFFPPSAVVAVAF